MPDKIKIIVLAGGQGKRMNSDLPKVLMPLKGRPLVSYLLSAIKASGVTSRPVIVVGFKADLVKEELGPDYDYIFQNQQLGTGHAVMCVADFLKNKAQNIMVLYGDQPLVGPATILKIVDTHLKNTAALTMVTVKLPDFDGWRSGFNQFGRIVRDQAGEIVKIVELKDCTGSESQITEVNPSYFCFKADWLWPNIEKLKNNNAQGEYYLTDLVELAIKQKQKVGSITVDPKEAIGVNTLEQLATIEKFL